MTSRIEFEITYAVSKAYLSQQYVDVTMGRFSDFVFDRQIHDPEQLVNSLRVLRNLLQELSGQEYVLQKNYQEALQAVEQMRANRN